MTTIKYPITEIIELALGKLVQIEFEKEQTKENYIQMQMRKERSKGWFKKVKYHWSYEEATAAFYRTHFEYFSAHSQLELMFASIEAPVKEILDKANKIYLQNPETMVEFEKFNMLA